MTDYTQFNFATNLNDKGLYSQLEHNVKDFLDWSFLQINGYNNVDIVSGVNPQHYQLHNVSGIVGLPSNRVWESPFKDWIWEQPEGKDINNIEGIYLNNVFLPSPTGSGNYGYHINYPLGRIVLDNPVNIKSDIKLEYSYRQIQIYKSEDSSWWKEVQRTNYGIFNDTQLFNELLSEHRLQAPFIMIENISRNQQIPYQLGTPENILVQDMFLHIFTKNPSQRSNLIDILLTQKDKNLILYDINKVLKDGVYGLNYRGEINLNGLNYRQILDNTDYHYKKCFIKNSTLSELNNFSTTLFNGIIRWTLEIFP